MRILAIESSCDESSVATLDAQSGALGQLIHSQIALHRAYGGVVPDLASREHLTNLPQLLAETPLAEPPTHLAVTQGPGLAPCLALGIAAARALGVAWGIPVLPVNHLRGHAYSPFIGLWQEHPRTFRERLGNLLPHLGLMVSGGNTLLFELRAPGDFHILAQTLDDAAGEALDKGAKLLGLSYPGGPLIEERARGGNSEAFDFPKAFPSRADMKFSFSGLKTSLRYRLEAMNDIELETSMRDLCASYQRAVVDALVRKLRQASEVCPYASIGLSGGVANNTLLREEVSTCAQAAKLPLLLAQPQHSGDNAAMIAFAAMLEPETPTASWSVAPSLTLS